MASLIEQNVEPKPQHFMSFLNDPGLCLQLVALLDNLDEAQDHEEPHTYSACIFAMDICVAQLQSAKESGHKMADKILQQLMSQVATVVRSGKHGLSFWLPILNAFYDVHVELSPELRDAYFELAYEDTSAEVDEETHLTSIREMITEFKDASVFDIAENFFAQSHAMPPEFFADLVLDLFSIEEAQEVGLLALLHPNWEVREVVVNVVDSLIDNITLNSQSLSRLQAIKAWYPDSFEEIFNRWIKVQRKKGVVFYHHQAATVAAIIASEVDGSGAQGLFIQFKTGRKHRLCGLLFKYETGIKDAWLTPEISAKELKQYYTDAFDDSVTLRPVDEDYLMTMTAHFLEKTIALGSIPDLHLLEIQELLGIQFLPKTLDVPSCIDNLSVQIVPFTEDILQASLKRSRAWLKNKPFTESWYIENAHIDKLVNRHCSYVDGVKTCHINEAITDVFLHDIELNRPRWLFHFLWISLWLKAKKRSNEKTWQDSFMIAYAIHSGMPMEAIPVLQEVVRQTVINSIETMADRRTHLTME